MNKSSPSRTKRKNSHKDEILSSRPVWWCTQFCQNTSCQIGSHIKYITHKKTSCSLIVIKVINCVAIKWQYHLESAPYYPPNVYRVSDCTSFSFTSMKQRDSPFHWIFIHFNVCENKKMMKPLQGLAVASAPTRKMLNRCTHFFQLM